MDLDRRSALRLAGIGAASALAGCLGDGGEGDGTPTETPTETPTGTPDGPGSSIVDHRSLGFGVRSSAPEWYRDRDDEPTGHAVVVDSGSRERAALDVDDLPEEREAEVQEFLEDVDYGTDRVVLLESVGPDTCHDRLEVADVRIEDGALAAGATVVDTREADEGCGDAITFPSSLLVVTFEGDPLDDAVVAFTDGWERTETVTASGDDPLPSPDPADLPGDIRPEGDPEPVAPLACDEADVKRHDQWYDEADVQWGDFETDGDVTLALRVDDLAYEYGDTARCTLTNVAGEEIDTGNRAKYNLQVYTEDGWQDVRVKDEDGYFEYTDEAVVHAPGEGFEWQFELTEDGIVEGTYHDDARVCPDLQAGRYRFAYFGVIGDGAVAVSFDLT